MFCSYCSHLKCLLSPATQVDTAHEEPEELDVIRDHTSGTLCSPAEGTPSWIALCTRSTCMHMQLSDNLKALDTSGPFHE